MKVQKTTVCLTAFVGCMVMVGWVFDIEILKSVIPNAVTMKFTTALAFTFSSFVIYGIIAHYLGDKDTAQIAIPASTLALLLILLPTLLGVVFGVSTGFENLFSFDSTAALMTNTPGRPSIGTVSAFYLIAITGLVILYDVEDYAKYCTLLGAGIFLLGMLALLGYLIKQPMLYYYYGPDGFSTAMAIHTATLFVLLGATLVSLKGSQYAPAH